MKSMRSLRIAGSILLSALFLQAADFSLKFFDDGPIMLHTILTFDGKGERLVATAKNESGAPIQKVKICINSASVKKGCLFELWNTTVWAPGEEFSWNVTTAVKTANLSHDAMIEEYENVNAPQTLSSAVSGTGAGGPPIRPANPSPPVQQDVLTNEALIKLAKAGVSDGVILGMVKSQPGKFLSSADAVIALKEAGVSDKVIAAVLERSDAPSSLVTVPKDKPTPIPQGVTLCLQPMPGSFDDFLIGEMQKQMVPATVIATVPNANDPSKPPACDPSKSSYTMTGNVVPEGKSFSARSLFGLRLHLRDEIQAAVKLVRNSDNAVVWAGDSDRGEVKTVAEHIVNQMLKQRPIWVLSPITR